MKTQLQFSAETATFLLEKKSPLFTATFVKANPQTGAVTIEVSAFDGETLAMAMFLAGQDYTIQQVKKAYNENSIPA